ncbi:unnamed protein product [Brassica rapa]|uniref:Uncharacterized protein n=2 Tax=Brassica TaxID=3705 RepID=A0A3P6B103_BRACM|nr:unnamed protein product [Brassica napus]CAG7895229.1 unnamed protein product [Brassica rapa]CDY46494.1 BnaA02g27440D [Brassica napus]VDC91590.1 unnamed protein product [Brassica rapa]
MKLVKLRPWLGSSGDILSSVVGRLLAPTLHLFVEGERSAYGSVSHCSFVLTAASLLELFPRALVWFSMVGGSNGLRFKSEAVENSALCSVVRLLEEISI